MTPVWLRGDGANSTLTLHVQPGAKVSELAGEHGEALKIRLAAPPRDGRANEALIAFLAERLGVPRRAITLQSGATSRHKVVALELPAATVAARLGY